LSLLAQNRGGLLDIHSMCSPGCGALVTLSLLTAIQRCDACRKRKICCTRDAYEKDCSLCRTRGESCKYVLPPNVRRNRAPNPAVGRPRASTSSSSSTTTSSIPPRPVQSLSANRPNGAPGGSEWICQFVGLSGDQDPFVLRHCTFNHLNCYKAPDWALLRIKGEPTSIPLHFTVRLSHRLRN
jgi:hypothetical protein